MGFSEIENIVGQTVRRDISRMKRFAEGQLERAARSIMSTPNAHVGIVTGFFIRNAVPPSPETDGLGGMAHMAAGLANAGIPVTVISDAPCSKAVWAITTELPEGVALEITSVSKDSVTSLRDRLAAAERPITHLIAIERVAPGSVAEILRRQLSTFQPEEPVADPAEVHAAKLMGILGIEVRVSQVLAKFKYGGNVDAAHRRAVVAQLNSRGDPGDEAAAEHVLRRLEAGG